MCSPGRKPVRLPPQSAYTPHLAGFTDRGRSQKWPGGGANCACCAWLMTTQETMASTSQMQCAGRHAPFKQTETPARNVENKSESQPVCGQFASACCGRDLVVNKKPQLLQESPVPGPGKRLPRRCASAFRTGRPHQHPGISAFVFDGRIKEDLMPSDFPCAVPCNVPARSFNAAGAGNRGSFTSFGMRSHGAHIMGTDSDCSADYQLTQALTFIGHYIGQSAERSAVHRVPQVALEADTPDSSPRSQSAFPA